MSCHLPNCDGGNSLLLALWYIGQVVNIDNIYYIHYIPTQIHDTTVGIRYCGTIN